MRRSFIAFVTVALLTSCKETNYKLDHVNSPKLAFDLIRLSVDSTLRIEKNMNTDNYVVDLSAIQNINKAGLDSFTKYKTAILPTTNEDSLIVFDDPSFERFHMKKGIIIKFDSIRVRAQRQIIVSIRKIKSSNQIMSLTLHVERDYDGYICRSVNHTNKR